MKLARDTWLLFQRQFSLRAAQPGLDLRRHHPAAVSTCSCSARCSSRRCRPVECDHRRATRTGSSCPACWCSWPSSATFFVGFGLIAELRAGVIERTRVTPVSRLALLLGRSLRDVVTLLFQAHSSPCWRSRSA